MVDEFLAEGLAFVGVLDGFFVADPGEADALDDDAHTFMVEVRHDDCEVMNLARVVTAYIGRLQVPLKPWFSLPIRFSTGTLTSSNVT